MTGSRTATHLPLDPPTRSLARRGRARAAALAIGALLTASTAVALAAPADAATGDINCPSSACVQVASNLGGPINAAPDNAGAVYVTYSSGELRKVDLATGASSAVASGLGNVRGAFVADGSAYVTSFGGTLDQVDLATGSVRTVAAGLPSLIGVTRNGDTTYATDGQGEIIAFPDGGTPKVVATGIGFSEGIAFDKAGFAYTADMGTGRIIQTDPATGATRVLSTGSYEPTSISVGADGQVYFWGGDDILRVNPTTTVQSRVTSIEGINSFTFSLATSGDAYALDAVGGLWQINGLTTR